MQGKIDENQTKILLTKIYQTVYTFQQCSAALPQVLLIEKEDYALPFEELSSTTSCAIRITCWLQSIANITQIVPF